MNRILKLSVLATFVGSMVMPVSRAVDPDRDYWLLVMPTLVPKAGLTSVPAGAGAGIIKAAYETTFESYWKKNTYFRHNETTGAKEHGWLVDTMTRGYYHQPWALSPRAAEALPNYVKLPGTMFPTGEGEPPDEGRQIYVKQADWDPLVDDVWTPGEAFLDANTNNVYDAPTNDEDRWLTDNDGSNRGANSCGEAIGFRTYRTLSVDTWDPRKGELFADYGGVRTDLSNGVVGYDRSVTIYIANEITRTNIPLVINELDLTPTLTCPDSNEGDFYHEYIPGAVGALPDPTQDIPRNQSFDYSADENQLPLVYPAYNSATPGGTNQLVVTYRSLVHIGNGNPYLGNMAASPTNVVATNINVLVYQSAELYNKKQISFIIGGVTNASEYGDDFVNPSAPNRPDGVWTEGNPGEMFEDFVSWYVPGTKANMTFVLDYMISSNELVITDVRDLHPARRGSNGFGIDAITYADYINWNYPGDTVGLIARAGNAVYNGADQWTDYGSAKWIHSEYVGEAIGPEPVPDVNWFTGVFATWQDWWIAAFGTVPPVWNDSIPNMIRYENQGLGHNNGYLPYDIFGYDGNREFADMASSMYHLSQATTSITINEFQGMVGPFGPVGDIELGEYTAPDSNAMYGADYGLDLPGGFADADMIIKSAGPWSYNVNGNFGYDAGNLLSLEYLTWRFDPAMGSPTPTNLPHYRDATLNGVIDVGEGRWGHEPYYASGPDGDGTGAYPFSRIRYLEDAMESVDVVQDFKDLVVSDNNPTMAPIYGFPIYPSGTAEGWGALGGPSGAVASMMTRDLPDPIVMFFQARPFSGSGLGGTTTDVPSGGIGGFQMGLVSHEMAHDIHGLPDLYDYDVWNGPSTQLNWPIGGFDLMSNGAMVHMIPDMKRFASGFGADEWTTTTPLETLLSTNAMCTGRTGPVVLEMYPVEDYENNYFTFGTLANASSPNASTTPLEYFSIWYQRGNDDFSQPGGQGVIISHSDLRGPSGDDGNPQQQRANGHFTWEIIQADGLNELQDGTDPIGDDGDTFPGSTGKYVFSADTIPAARWYSNQDSGLRILDIQLPANDGEPALVTLEWLCITEPWVVPEVGADSDGDSLIDAWEFHYYGHIDIADGTSDLDFDGLEDYYEFLAHLDPTDAYSGDPVNRQVSDADLDIEPDGLSNIEEQTVNTNPRDPDTDDDNFSDGQEVNVLQLSGGRSITDPLFSLSPQINRSMCLTGNPVFVPGQLEVGGVNRFELNQFTIETWVMVSGTQTGSLISRATVNGNLNFELRLDNNVPRIRFANSAGTLYQALGPAPISSGSWVHLAGVFDTTRKSLELYVNGVIVSENTILGAVPATGASSVQGNGRSSGTTTLGNGIIGNMDEVRIWNVPLSDTQIATNYNRIIDTPWVTGASQGLVANYRFDDSFNSDPAEADGFEDFRHLLDFRYAITNNCVSLSSPTLVGNGLNGAPWDDLNDDTIPDWWQALYFDGFDPSLSCAGTNAVPIWCPGENPDNDLLTNLEEWIADTNPLNGQNNVAIPTNPVVNAITVTVVEPDGLYTKCQTLEVLILFPSNVTVVGTPILRLDANPATAFATYAGQTSPTVLSFTYKIDAGEVSADLDYASQYALEQNGGMIIWSNTLTEIDYTLALPGSPGSISNAKQIMVDGNQEDLVGGVPRCSASLVVGTVSDCPLDSSLDSLGAAWTTGASTPGGPSSDPLKIWSCTSDRVRTGSFSMTAGGLGPSSPNLKDDETAWVQTQVVGPGEICFSWIYSVEPHIFPDLSDPADYVRFLIDGVVQVKKTGENLTWETQCYTVPAGVHTVRWEYKKDNFLSWRLDQVWVDDIQFNHLGADTDGDGLSDAYENIYGTLVNDPDTDGDGVTDYNEVRFGLDPLVAETVAVSSSTGPNCVEWAALTGQKFIVQRTGSLSPADWLPAPNGAAANEKSTRIATMNSTLDYCDPDPLPGSNFYRVILVP